MAGHGGTVVHIAYLLAPCVALVAAFMSGFWYLRKRSFASVLDRTMLMWCGGTVGLWVAWAWMMTAPADSNGFLQLLMIVPSVAFLLAAVATVLVVVVLSLVRFAQRRTPTGLTLLIAALILGTATGALPIALQLIDTPAKRLMREYVVRRMIVEPSVARGADGGYWNRGLPGGWGWLSADGQVNWTGVGAHAQVAFCDQSGIMAGSGYVFCVDGGPPSNPLGDIDPSAVAPGWYSWVEE